MKKLIPKYQKGNILTRISKRMGDLINTLNSKLNANNKSSNLVSKSNNNRLPSGAVNPVDKLISTVTSKETWNKVGQALKPYEMLADFIPVFGTFYRLGKKEYKDAAFNLAGDIPMIGTVGKIFKNTNKVRKGLKSSLKIGKRDIINPNESIDAIDSALGIRHIESRGLDPSYQDFLHRLKFGLWSPSGSVDDLIHDSDLILHNSLNQNDIIVPLATKPLFPLVRSVSDEEYQSRSGLK